MRYQIGLNMALFCDSQTATNRPTDGSSPVRDWASTADTHLLAELVPYVNDSRHTRDLADCLEWRFCRRIHDQGP